MEFVKKILGELGFEDANKAPEKVTLKDMILKLEKEGLNHENIAEQLRMAGYRTERGGTINKRYVRYKIKKIKSESVPRRLKNRNHLVGWLRRYGRR